MTFQPIIMYPSFTVSKPIANYHLPQSLNMVQSGMHSKEDPVDLRCPSYAFQLMTGILEVMSDVHLQDVTLVCCDGQFIRSNKLLLAASSPYFRQHFAFPGSEIYLPGITSEVLNILLVFILQGNVQVKPSILPFVITAATTLNIRGFQSACSMIPRFLNGDTRQQDFKSDFDKPSKKRKLEVEVNLLESRSASLFRPWSVSSASAKEIGSNKLKSDGFSTMATSHCSNNTTSFMVPTISLSPPISSKPSCLLRNVSSTPVVPNSIMNNSSCGSPNTSIDFAPLLASTMKNKAEIMAHADCVVSKEASKRPVDIIPTSPLGLSAALGHNPDSLTSLSDTYERIRDSTSDNGDVSHLKSTLVSVNQFSTPKSHPNLVPRTPIELVKSYPLSVTKVLCGPLPLFDDSKEDTVVEYRDESDNEGNLVIDIEELNEK